MSYREELAFYHMIASGDLTGVKEHINRYGRYSAADNTQNGTLSANPLQNERYHFVVLTALLTRICVEAGLLQERAYTLSDLYINQTDIQPDIAGIVSLQNDMILAYAKEMAAMKKGQVYSMHISNAIDYICNHITERLFVEDIATALKLNRSYLSTLFKKETGKTIHAFIRQERIKAAHNLLRYSDYGYSEIAEYLGFSSQSHFCQTFKNETGFSPAEYRNTFYHSGKFDAL